MTEVFGSGRPKLIQNRQSFGSPRGSPIQSNQNQDSIGLLIITAQHMTDTEIDPIIEDAKNANTELHIEATNGREIYLFYKKKEDLDNNFETSEIELLTSLSSST